MKESNKSSNIAHIKDEISVLSNVNLMKQKQKEIMNILNENTVMHRISSELLRLTEEIGNLATDIKNSRDSINFYYYKTTYNTESLEAYKLSTNKNAYIYDIKINKNVSIDNLTQPITIKVRNLGFKGVVAEDIIKLKFFNSSLNEKFEFEKEVNTYITDLRVDKEITIDEVPYPTIPYEYSLTIQLLSNGKVYGETTVRGINVIGGAV